MKNLRNEKRFIQGKKNILNSLIEKIKLDVKDMQAATMQLDELYKKEQDFTTEKEKEMAALDNRLQESQERKDMLLFLIDKFSVAKTFLDSLAKLNNFPDVINLVRSYLILEALNEQFLQLELESMMAMKKIQDMHSEMENLLKEHRSNVMELEKRYENLVCQQQNSKSANSELRQLLDNKLISQKDEDASWEQIKRWASGMCKKISIYKDTSIQPKDFIKQLDEIYDFIEASKKILKK
ncbi:hypothetical protein HNY73_008011 [Argiope bruennichi]|uniref:Uncharacterized protein n=1 Tax=Argiope bruennichi TaxID=94029 RepID=A0A8T0F598_ARGBR|nr:hypothetical protein HNY73_008011 [Argiope bruennichi]